MDPRTETMQHALKRLPVNDMGLPEGLYRADLLPFPVNKNQLPNQETADTKDPLDPIQNWEFYSEYEQSLSQAYVELEYLDGIPQLPNGLPIWDRLGWEPKDSHKAFQVFLQEGAKGKARQLKRVLLSLHATLDEDPNFLDITPDDLTIQVIQEWYILYMWHARTISYDAYAEASRRKHRAFQSRKTEDSQLSAARKMFNKALNYIMEDEEFDDLMTPKVAVELVKLAASMERVSTGLPANGPPTQNQQGNIQGGESLEFILRNLHMTSSNQNNDPNNKARRSALPGGRTLDGDGNDLSDKLAAEGDTDTSILAQELIIRLQQGQQN